MKISIVPILVATLALGAGCSSLDNPLANLFHGHDARVYNPQTGEWEYPNKKATPSPQKSAAIASALSSTPAPQGSGHSADWVEPRKVPDPTSAPSNATASAGGADPASGAPAPAPAPTPPPPRPKRATGIYNPATGKIEWQTTGETTASANPPPSDSKHWWWPFRGETTASATPPPSATKHWWWPF